MPQTFDRSASFTRRFTTSTVCSSMDQLAARQFRRDRICNRRPRRWLRPATGNSSQPVPALEDWVTPRKDRTKAQVRVELDRMLEFVSNCRTDLMGWTLMSTLCRSRCLTISSDAQFADCGRTIRETIAMLSFLARRERVRSLFQAGRNRKGSYAVQRTAGGSIDFRPAT